MAILDIITVDSDEEEVLCRKAKDLDRPDILSSEIQTLIEDMMDTCHAADGLGLAACQVGSPANIFVYREPGKAGYNVMINPVITDKASKMTSKGEGCLSVPGQYFNVKRYKKVIVEGLDRNGDKLIIITKSKALAKIFQHEVDHLNGITIADKGRKVT
ncbi:MAG: hypothetical protein AMJ56_07630 [Anaerolineae bacterium SG8_19]|nr:MAG: hypothetical protein AMJ56_07630 [Anaerolineae bacterium SG8_19]